MYNQPHKSVLAGTRQVYPLKKQHCKTTGLLLSALACAVTAQVYAEAPMRCVVDHEGKWLCGTPEQVPLSLAAPVPEKPVTTPVAAPKVTTAPTPPVATTPATPTKTVVEVVEPSAPASEPVAVTKQPKPVATPTKPVTRQVIANSSCPLPSGSRKGPATLVNRADAPLSIDADDMEIHGKNVFIYQGKVTMERADQSLLADKATYNHDLGTFEAEGNLHYKESGTELEGDHMKLNTNTDRGTIDNASYRILDTGASGDAEQIEMASRYINRYHNATYTTCPATDKSWELEAEQVELDELEGWGSAKNAVVSFKGVPILYTPSYTFPLDERRKSGVLFPSWGYTESGGGDVSAPYYLNLAANRDATITPRIIGKRGISLSGNFRYLNIDNQGEVDASFLPSDDLHGDDRYQFKLDHQGTLQSAELINPVSYTVDFSTLSDKDYLTDFGNTLGLSSSDTLEQTATISYSQDRWSLSALLSDHYTVSKTLAASSEPYRKLPQIDGSWSSKNRDNQLSYSIAGQFVHFDHNTLTNAERYWVKPSASYNLTLLDDAAYIKPSVSIAQSHYSLDSGGSSSLTVPHYTVKSGLFLERDTSNYLHTLEPSIQFSYIPDGKSSGHDFENNSDDNSQFYGKDGAPHTKLVTLAVSSDLLSNSDGSKLLATSLERSRDFRSDRTQDWNDLISKITAESGAHNAALKIHLDKPQSSYTSWSNTLHADYQYDNDAGQLMNFGYIHERGSKKQLDLSGAWELNSRWNLFARYNHELISSNNHRLEDLIGVSYDSCCWSASFTRRSYFTGTSNSVNQFDTAWFFVLELKGMGKLGKSGNLNELLEQSIKGYNSDS